MLAGGYKVDIAVGALPQKVATYGMEVLNDLVGAKYEPVAYLGSQVVNGINHAILTVQTLVTASPVKSLRVVVLNEKPSSETKSDFTIVTIGSPLLTYASPGMTGGYAEPEDFAKTAPEAAALWSKCRQPIGKTYDTKCVLGTQVVAGTNYAILAESKVVAPGAVAEASILYLWSKLDGTVELNDIADIDF
jgi:hypothetical protein